MLESVFIGLGSNLGDSYANLTSAIHEFNNFQACKVVTVSPFYFSEPVGYIDQPWFLNGIIKLSTYNSPRILFELCQKLEKKYDRKRTLRWGPRTLDLDILIWENRILVSKKITIPHPQIQFRRFVLKPFSDIDPECRHPILGKSMAQLLEDLSDTYRVIPAGQKERRLTYAAKTSNSSFNYKAKIKIKNRNVDCL